MLARVAQVLFSCSRDLERAEGVARLIEVGQALALEGDSSNGRAGEMVWEPLVRVVGDVDHFMLTHRRADARSVLWSFAFDPGSPDSIVGCLRRAREGARSVRDRLPTEVWEAINAAGAVPAAWPPRRIVRDGVYPFCRAIRGASQRIAGAMDAGMRRDEAWEFMCLGRFTERASRTARLVAARYASGGAAGGWATGPFALPTGDPVADEARLLVDGRGIAPSAMCRLLMLDDRSPRSVAYCLAHIEGAITRLVEIGAMAPDPSARTLTRAARATIRDAAEGPWGPDEVDRLAVSIEARAASIADAIAEACFLSPRGRLDGHHAQASRQAQN